MARSMMSRRQAADILGLHDDTNAREIKMAYRKLAIKWHPDKNQGNESATEMFQLIGAAYECLCEENNMVCQFWTEEDLFYAAEEGDVVEIKALLEAGVDLVNTTDKWGFTALHKAAQRGQHWVVKVLLERPEALRLSKAVVRLGGSTPLLLAVEKGHLAGHLQCIKYLLAACHAPELLEVRDRSSGQTALEMARANHARAVKYGESGVAEQAEPRPRALRPAAPLPVPILAHGCGGRVWQRVVSELLRFLPDEARGCEAAHAEPATGAKGRP